MGQTVAEDRKRREDERADALMRVVLTPRLAGAVLRYIDEEAAYRSRDSFSDGFNKGMERGRAENSDVVKAARAENEWFIQKHAEGLVRLTEDVRHRDDCHGWSENGPREKWCPHLEVLNRTRAALDGKAV